MAKTLREKLSIKLIKPKFEIHQTVYIPQKNQPQTNKIIRYNLEVGKVKDRLLGRLKSYEMEDMVSLREGTEISGTFSIQGYHIYSDKKKAEEASKFLPVIANEEQWKLAVGDRNIKDKDSPYNINNSDLLPCCGSISEARDILLYCKNTQGLIIHERDELRNELFNTHDHDFQKDSPLSKILSQLGII
ncbi:hypothetical protein HOE04_03895 [archaeon]|jgi:hypothetical protein|nr:hypothetical protein [archaeon]